MEPVNCNRTRIGQLASNLIGNALTHGARDMPVRVGAKTEGDEFGLWVANAGEPIPEAAMQRLFEPFFRGDVRDSRQGSRTGTSYRFADHASAWRPHRGDVEAGGNPVRVHDATHPNGTKLNARES
jgi:light-regulated signal transduction histidine kinase (bacteriophytochrome)